MTALELVRLLQLAAPSLPIGGFSHSHGLESAALQGVVIDEATALRFIADVFEFSVRRFEIPLLLALHAAWLDECPARALALNEESLATRESAELRAASVQMGYSLRALLAVLPDMPRGTLEVLDSMQEPGLPCCWSAAAAAWGLDARAAALAYAWSWAENQVLAALKAVPLGQSAGQRMLLALGTKIAQSLEQPLPEFALPELASAGLAPTDVALTNLAPTGHALADLARSDVGTDELAPGAGVAAGQGATVSNFAPALAILSARHETQYSRLFRS